MFMNLPFFLSIVSALIKYVDTRVRNFQGPICDLQIPPRELPRDPFRCFMSENDAFLPTHDLPCLFFWPPYADADRTLPGNVTLWT
jgi:hypothetical protein